MKYKEKVQLHLKGKKPLKTIMSPPTGPGHVKSAEALPPKSREDFQSLKWSHMLCLCLEVKYYR